MRVRTLPDGRIELGEVTPVAMSLGTTAWNRTGAWRSREPVFQDRTAPCAAACPLGQDLPDQLRLAAQGRLGDAAVLLLAANPMPATTGRVCPRFCRAACNRAALDGAVDVPGVERALGDLLLAEGTASPPTVSRLGLRVAVVGAGPAGLAAAHRLALSGADVRLLAREARPGGLLATGIPPWRLPRAVLDGEIARVLSAGIRFEGGRTLGEDLALEGLAREHDGVVIAVGRQAPRGLGVPGASADGVIDGLALLERIHRGEPAPPGEVAVVVGGGNTALDCARTLLRLGRSVTVLYRRGREEMPAFQEEIAEAIEEGVALETWALPSELVVRGGRARWLRACRARPGAPDASGRPAPEPIPGGEFVLPVDLVVVAAGETLDPAGLPPALVGRGGVVADADARTAVPNLWAAGDCLAGGGTVSQALASGHRAADALLAALAGIPRPPGPLAARVAAERVGPERIRAHHLPPAAPLGRGRAGVAERLAGAEVQRGFAPEAARAEAARCVSCGSCTGCDVCHRVCPDRAVLRGAPGGYAVDRDRCKGCGICVEECPRGAVELAAVAGGR